MANRYTTKQLHVVAKALTQLHRKFKPKDYSKNKAMGGEIFVITVQSTTSAPPSPLAFNSFHLAEFKNKTHCLDFNEKLDKIKVYKLSK